MFGKQKENSLMFKYLMNVLTNLLLNKINMRCFRIHKITQKTIRSFPKEKNNQKMLNTLPYRIKNPITQTSFEEI